jgi:hypothetical protein
LFQYSWCSCRFLLFLFENLCALVSRSQWHWYANRFIRNLFEFPWALKFCFIWCVSSRPCIIPGWNHFRPGTM